MKVRDTAEIAAMLAHARAEVTESGEAPYCLGVVAALAWAAHEPGARAPATHTALPATYGPICHERRAVDAIANGETTDSELSRGAAAGAGHALSWILEQADAPPLVYA